MGSQSLEILRQGIWASLTGGWFYDPHQNIFCNSIHLYLWIFLLCGPFVTYLYCGLTAWIVYCSTVFVLMTTLKIVNLSLHRMYDRAQILSDPNLKKTLSGQRTNIGDDDDEVGIEMQVLGHPERSSRISGERRSDEISSAHSAVSFEFHGPLSSVVTAAGPIDFKVDVHRKNSSESSSGDSVAGAAAGTATSGKRSKSIKVRVAEERPQFESNEAGTSQSGGAGDNRDLKTFIDDVMRRSRRRDAKKDRKRERKKKKKPASESSSTSSGSRNSSSTSTTCHSEGDSSSHGNRIYKYDSSGGEGGSCSSSSGSSSSCTLSKQPKESGGRGDKATKAAQGNAREGSSTAEKSLPDDGLAVAEFSSNMVDGATAGNALAKEKPSSGAKKKRFHSARLQRQVSLDTDEMLMEQLYFSILGDDQRRAAGVLQRHRSTDSEETCTNTSNISLGIMPPSSSSTSANNHHHHHYHQYAIRPHLASLLYMDGGGYTTKSELTIENIPTAGTGKLFLMQPATPMRKDSNSTMSAIQLPIATAPSIATSKIRQLANGRGHAAAETASGTTVRRIKSAALETSGGPATGFVCTQPNSVEAIAGRSNNALPPPSKSLSRNPHLNLYPKKHSSHSSVAIGEQPVYPIAEHEVDDASSSAAGVARGPPINHPLSSIRLPSDTDDSESEATTASGGGGLASRRTILEKYHQPKSAAIKVNELESIRLEIEESGEEEGQDGTRARTKKRNDGEIGEDLEKGHEEEEENEENGDENHLKTPSNIEPRRCSQGTATTDSDTENNGSQSPLLECGLNDRSNRIVIVEVKSNLGGSSAAAAGKSSLSDHKSQLAGNIVATVDETMANRLRRKPAKRVKTAGPKSESDSGFRSNDWDYASGSSKLNILQGGSGDVVTAGVFGVESTDMRSSRGRHSLSKGGSGDGGGRTERDEEESDYVHMKSLRYLNPSRLDLPQPLLEANLAAVREFRERVAPLTRGRAFRYHGSQSSASGVPQMSTFFKPLPVDPEMPSSTSMEFNPFGGTRFFKLPDASPFVRNMTTRSARYSNSRGRRQASFEGTASSSRDDFDQGAVGVGGTASSVPAGMESEFGSGTIGGGSIDTYTGVIEKILSNQNVPAGAGTVPPAAINRVNEAMMDYIRYIKNSKQKLPKKYYKLKLPMSGCGWRREIQISMDRLQLLALFDRDAGWFQVLLAIVLTCLVAILGAMILQMGFYADILAFIFCFVMAGSQYSLLKSVQPDAASPIHGFNKTVAYSRPIYFCLCAGLLIGIHRLIGDGSQVATMDAVDLFGVPFHGYSFFAALRYGLATMLLFFPVLFSLGLFPQINTFFMYFLEQVDMHVFGGNAVCGLVAGLVGVTKSILACFILYGLAYGGVIEPRGTQHISFSIFCAALVPITYHMSRCASDFTNIWVLIKSSLVIHSEDEEEVGGVEKKDVRSRKDDDLEDEEMRCGSGDRLKDSDRSEGQSTAAEAGKSALSLQPLPSTNTNSRLSMRMEGSLDAGGGGASTAAVNNATIGPTNALRSDSTATNSSLSYMLRDGDPLPRKLQKTVNARLRHDLLVCIFMAIVVMALHCSTIFTVLQPEVNPALHTLAIVLGFILHYLMPQMRKQWPWLCVSDPILRPADFRHYEAKEATKVSWFESMYVYLCFLERNVLYPVLFLSALTGDAPAIVQKFGPYLGSAIVVVCGLKGLRNAYSDTASQYLIVIFTVLYFQVDASESSETFLVDYFLVSILYRKISEFLLKLQFIVTYIAPWQITWGSAFHAFAQPFSVPHSAMLFVQAGISSALSTPLNPFLGSAIFITSYVRPIKFWERDYNTRRIDHSNTRLSLQLERDLGADDNNLNSIFYEHLTQSLQHSLCGDLIMGRWGQVSQGDCFVLASDYLNCLVHIIELGNGLCTFQIRGLEFRGTYCQQREVEAISEGIEDNVDCCCCSPGHIKNMLSVNSMFSARWLAWQVVAAQYVIEGYSISDNSATTLLTVYEFRRALITYYVKSVIFYIVRSPKLDQWLKSEAMQEALQMTLDPQFVDLDPAFNMHLDEDFDSRVAGITRTSFCAVYLEWIKYCFEMRGKEMAEKEQKKAKEGDQQATGTNSGNQKEGSNIPKHIDVSALVFEAIEKSLVSLCFALTLLARRTLATASHGRQYSNFEFFLHGLHALFKGDFRITSPRDEWVFADMDLLHTVVAPAVRMSLKLHQDYFQNPEQYEDLSQLYTTIVYISNEIVISHEADPAWRSAVLRGVPNLLALRHVIDDGGDEYRIIRLTKGFLSFRVIKLNRECVRGLWSGQQQELIYLRNRNPERGSIQNAKQALRNIINSSCDQPIGYPIYVSPLTTSYAETNEQLCGIVGGPASFEKMRTMFLELCRRVRRRCHEGCSSGSSLDCDGGDMQGVYCAPNTPSNTLATIGSGQTAYGSQSLSLTGGGVGATAAGVGGSGSVAGTRGSLASMGKPYSSTLLAGFLRGERDLDRESVRDGRSSQKQGSKRSESRSERRATLPASTSNLNQVTSKSEMIMMMGLSSGSGASGSGVQQGHSGNLGAKDSNTAESSSLTLNTSSSNFLNMSRAPNLKSLSFESKRGPVERDGAAAVGNRAASSELSLPVISLNKKVIIVDQGEVSKPPGEQFVAVGENVVMDFSHTNAPEVRGETVSAENLHGLSRRSRSSRSRRMSDSIRKLKSEEEPAMPVVVVPEEERSDIAPDEAEEVMGQVSPVVVVTKEQGSPKDAGDVVEGDKAVSAVVIVPPDEDRAESRSLTNIEEELARVRE